MNIKVKKIASHRNGVSGEGFYVILFTIKNGRKNRNMVATIFQGRGHVAILDVDETKAGNIEFGMGNSWRGDDFEIELQDALVAQYGEGMVW